MIVKHIGNPKSPSSKAKRIGSLLDYITADGHKEAEKTEFTAACGDFLSDSPQGRRAEMVALAQEAKRSKDPVDHWLLSWKEGEQPTHAQCREAVELLKKNLGMSASHLAVFALHRNTDNYHLHIVLNRVHPETLQVSDKGWCIDRAHKALAEIVQVQGWEAEQNARYGKASSQAHTLPILDHAAMPSTRARDYENATGAKSAERIAIEQAAPILKAARSWSEVHERLGLLEMRYEQKGSGALVWVGEIAVKASICGREFSRKRMEERLGEYKEGSSSLRQITRNKDAEDLYPNMPATSAAYRAARGQHFKEKNAAQTSQYAAHHAERMKQLEAFRVERTQLNTGAKWSGASLNVARSLLAAEHAKRRAALAEKQKREKKELREKFGQFVTYEEYLRSIGEEQLAERWRYRKNTTQAASILGEDEPEPEERDIRDFTAQVQFSVKDRIAAIHYCANNAPDHISFTDVGRRIDVWQQQDEAAVLAALQLGAQKWGVLTITGPNEFKHLCASLAAQHGIRISNPELNLQLQHRSGITNLSQDTVRTPDEDYQLHKADILNRVAVKNACQLDWMIAIRMRVTGHDQRAIAQVLESQAPLGRTAEIRNWKNYAERTASAVFGSRGDAETARNQSRAATWIRIVGREPCWSAAVTPKKHQVMIRQSEKGLARE